MKRSGCALSGGRFVPKNRRKRASVIAGAAIAAVSIGVFSSRVSAQVSETLGGSWTLDPSNDTGGGVSGTGIAPQVTNTEGEADALFDNFTPVVLNVGSMITFSGTLQFPDTLTGNEQFRFGIFNANNPGTSETGWAGYYSITPNSGNSGELGGLNGVGDWYTLAVSDALTTTTNNPTVDAPGTPATENFSISVRVVSPGTMLVDTSMKSSDSTYVWTSDATDSATPSASNTTYNEVGLEFGNSMFGGGVTGATITDFSNLSVVATVPEPVCAGLVIVGGMGLLMRRRSKCGRESF